ncbi:hypothetical protein [Streptomyces buecherae]|uniref:hypothetical protein n=1 Tax=Streptomyces buecherae TaxID=2763006 RepID=UPI00379D7FAA
MCYVPAGPPTGRAPLHERRSSAARATTARTATSRTATARTGAPVAAGDRGT